MNMDVAGRITINRHPKTIFADDTHMDKNTLANHYTPGEPP